MPIRERRQNVSRRPRPPHAARVQSVAPPEDRTKNRTDHAQIFAQRPNQTPNHPRQDPSGPRAPTFGPTLPRCSVWRHDGGTRAREDASGGRRTGRIHPFTTNNLPIALLTVYCRLVTYSWTGVRTVLHSRVTHHEHITRAAIYFLLCL